MLDVKMLKSMPDGCMFSVGTVSKEDSKELYDFDGELKFVAVRGSGYHDWAIYFDYDFKTEKEIAQWGHKLHNRAIIKKLVPCSDSALEMYRD